MAKYNKDLEKIKQTSLLFLFAFNEKKLLNEIMRHIIRTISGIYQKH